MSLLEASEINSGYGDIEILHGVSLTVGRGEMVTVIGPNGCGKSTLMKTIFGLLTPTRARSRSRMRTSPACRPTKSSARA